MATHLASMLQRAPFQITSLPSAFRRTTPDSALTVVGWGSTTAPWGHTTMSDVLLEAGAKSISREDAQAFLDNTANATNVTLSSHGLYGWSGEGTTICHVS